MMRMWAIKSHVMALSSVRSQSLARRLDRPSHAKVRSTTHLRGKTMNPSAFSDRLMISRFHSQILLSAVRSFSPA